MPVLVFVALAGLVLVGFLSRQNNQTHNAYQVDTDTELPDQTPTFFEAATVNIDLASLITPSVAPDVAVNNEKAFLDMLAYSEGTSGPNGYRTFFGGSLFESYADHPRRFFEFTDKAGRRLKTSAAGRYQFLSRTWDELKTKLDLPDFGPESQDAAALELIRQRGATNDVRAGRVSTAVKKCAPTWASLPGAGYSQPERKLDSLLTAYTNAGGLNEVA